MAATISPCGLYRYTLSRELPGLYGDGSTALFVMLNPSTADANVDDPTIRRCISFAREWGCARLEVVNLYAYRSTDPSALWDVVDPVGPDNAEHLRRAARRAKHAVCAWGANAHSEIAIPACETLKAAGCELWCLGLTKSGHPKHPLYVKSGTPRIPYSEEFLKRY